MGREVKRVPIDFNWPMRQIWKGYYNPYNKLECRSCEGHGYSDEYKKLEDEWYGWDKSNRHDAWMYNLDEDDVKALMDDGRLWDFTRRPINEEQKKIVEEKGGYWLPEWNGYTPTPEEVNEWAKKGIGHDSINCWTVISAKLKKLELPKLCPICEGDGGFYPTDEYKELAENWKQIEPPVGEGWQMWETTSEGSPIFPVFDTPEKLAQWLADNNASAFGNNTTSYENWLSMITSTGWAMTMVGTPEGIKSGVDFAAENKEG